MSGTSTGPGVEGWGLEGLQKEDPHAIQMWGLYAHTKANLLHAQRMENPTCRMVGVLLRRNWPFRFSNAQKKYGTGSNSSVRYPCHPLHTIRALMTSSQVVSEKAKLLAAPIEYETSWIRSTTSTRNYWTSINSTPT